jgi:urease subunit alpha
MIATALMGDPNASIPTPQPVHYRAQFGAAPGALAQTCITFLSQAAIEQSVHQKLELKRLVSPVRAIRGVRKSDMKLNDATPEITVHPENYRVHADGVLLHCEPASVLPMAQRYFLF